jgi:hypothetical protein
MLAITQDVPVPPLPPELFMPGPTPLEIAGAVALVVGTIGLVGILWLYVRGLLRKWSNPAPADGTGIQELRHEIRQLGAEVGELQERLDFTERVLASRSEPERIDRGKP